MLQIPDWLAQNGWLGHMLEGLVMWWLVWLATRRNPLAAGLFVIA